MVLSWLSDVGNSLLHLAFPHICQGCGTDVIDTGHQLCIRCLAELPHTHFHLHADNPVERAFWGRLPLQAATAQYYFTKESGMQHLMHQFKYRGNKELGLYLGQLMGQAFAQTHRFSNVDALLPLPLYGSKERARGFNQALVLCQGIAQVWARPILTGTVVRKEATESQTRKNRVERWQNMEGRFEVVKEEMIKGKHILLVDDVITTGATLESCGKAITQVPDARLSIATLCYASNL